MPSCRRCRDTYLAADCTAALLQEHPEAWTRVDAILESSKNQQTKFFGLQVRRAAAPLLRLRLCLSCTCCLRLFTALLLTAAACVSARLLLVPLLPLCKLLR